MDMVTIDDIYACFDVISGDSITEDKKVEAYNKILLGTKGDEKVKRLCSQFIGRFFKRFKALQDDSFNCLLDLCDDADANIRKQAISDLQQVCRCDESHISRVADILGQMLSTDDASESHIISIALYNLLLSSPKSTLTGIFNQMLADSSESPRDHILKFLSDNLKRLPDDVLNPDVEEFIMDQTNKVLLDVSEDEFIQIISVLSSLKGMSSVKGRQKLVDMITSQVVLANPVFNPQDPASLAQVRESGKQTLRFLSKNVTAGMFLKYMLENVLPQFSNLANPDDKCCLLRILTIFTLHPGDALSSLSLEGRISCLLNLYEILLKALPTVQPNPISDCAQDKDSSQVSGTTETNTPADISSINIFHLECLLCSLVNLVKLCPQFLQLTKTEQISSNPSDVSVERIQTLRPRLQYLACLLQSYRTIFIMNSLKDIRCDDSNMENLKLEARKAMTNIEVLVRFLFHNRPNFETLAITPSWSEPTTPVPGEKRVATVQVAQPKSISSDATGTGSFHKGQSYYQVPVGRRGRGGSRKAFRGGRIL